MINKNPDKYIRKAIYDRLNAIVVSDKIIYCYDTRVSGSANNNQYILFTAQTKDIDKATKCGYRWETSILIEIFTKSSSAGNSGSRVLVNDIEEACYNLLTPYLTFNDFVTQNQIFTFDAQLETVTDTENIFRSFIRLNLTLI